MNTTAYPPGTAAPGYWSSSGIDSTAVHIEYSCIVDNSFMCHAAPASLGNSGGAVQPSAEGQEPWKAGGTGSFRHVGSQHTFCGDLCMEGKFRQMLIQGAWLFYDRKDSVLPFAWDKPDVQSAVRMEDGF